MILLGIKTVNASGSSNDSYGYSSFSITASNVTIIKEGTKTELKTYVYEQRQQKDMYIDTFDKLLLIEGDVL